MGKVARSLGQSKVVRFAVQNFTWLGSEDSRRLHPSNTTVPGETPSGAGQVNLQKSGTQSIDELITVGQSIINQLASVNRLISQSVSRSVIHQPLNQPSVNCIYRLLNLHIAHVMHWFCLCRQLCLLGYNFATRKQPTSHKSATLSTISQLYV